MKYLYISAFFLVLCFSACRKNSDLIDTEAENPSSAAIATVDLSWWAVVVEEESLRDWGGLSTNSIHNASVKFDVYGGGIMGVKYR